MREVGHLDGVIDVGLLLGIVVVTADGTRLGVLVGSKVG